MLLNTRDIFLSIWESRCRVFWAKVALSEVWLARSTDDKFTAIKFQENNDQYAEQELLIT